MHFTNAVCGGLALFISLAFAEVSVELTAAQNAVSACNQLHTPLGNVTILRSDAGYANASEENWSATARQRPACIIQPQSVSELQTAVKVLSNRNVPFAIRSGGHMPSAGAANTNNGVLIDLSGFNQISYDAANSLATIGTGQRWGNVYAALEQYNMTAVGGRVLDVGVGGLILGSGLSYLSDLYGMACDNVVNFQVVTSDGCLVNANATSNTDLFWALKGGANNFGIVTDFTINTYPQGPVWGGIRQYSLDHLPVVMAALNAYQSNPNKDPYANLMVQAAPTNATTVGVLLNMVYLKPVVNASAFAPFASIPSQLDTTTIQSFTTFMSGAVLPPIARWDWQATSFEPDAALYEEIVNITTSPALLAPFQNITTATLVMGVQPISASVAHAGQVRGGNALGLQAVNQTWFVLDIGWTDPAQDDAVHAATAAVLAQVEAAAKRRGKYQEYIFMNDASVSQDVIGHYGRANVERLRRVQSRYDPTGVFHRLVTGGFKVPQGSGY